MRPPGIWGAKEFAQFTEEELHETMMDSQPGSNYFEWAKAELEHRDRRGRSVQSIALQVLQAIYDRTRGRAEPIFVTELNIGIGEEDSKAAWRYLKDKGLIQTFNLDYAARINATGVEAIENARLHPDQPSTGFPQVTYNVVNIGTAIQSPVQQSGARSTQYQNAAFSPEELSNLRQLVTKLSDHLEELNLNVSLKQKAAAQIATLEAQLTDEPDPTIVQQAGRTLRGITEGAIGSLIAAAVQPTLWHWVLSAMVALFPK